MADSRTTVVIPYFNSQKTIERAIGSALLQEPVAVVVVDDGSEDGGLSALEAKYTNVQFVAQCNQGACHARNTGLSQVSTEYVQFLDADDELLPGKIAAQEKVLSANSSAGLVAGSYVREDLSKTRIRRDCEERDPWLGCVNADLGITSSLLFRVAAVQGVGGWCEGLSSSQEYDLMYRVMASGWECVSSVECLTVVYSQPNSITSSSGAKKWQNFAELRLRIYEHLVSAGELGADRAHALGGILLMACRNAYRCDPAVGLELWRRIESMGVRLNASRYSVGYRLLLSCFGFSGAERICRSLRIRR